VRRLASIISVAKYSALGEALTTSELNSALNVSGFILTALGTYLTIKGNQKIKKGKAIVEIARRNLLIQVAANEISTLQNKIMMLGAYVTSRNWVIAQHIATELSSKLHESKTAFLEIKGTNRDRLEVAARTAARMNEYFTTTTDGDDDKAQKLRSFCNDLEIFLADIHGALKFK